MIVAVLIASALVIAVGLFADRRSTNRERRQHRRGSLILAAHTAATRKRYRVMGGHGG